MLALLAYSTIFAFGGMIGLMASFFPLAYDLDPTERQHFQLTMGVFLGMGLVGMKFFWPAISP